MVGWAALEASAGPVPMIDTHVAGSTEFQYRPASVGGFPSLLLIPSGSVVAAVVEERLAFGAGVGERAPATRHARAAHGWATLGL